MSAEPFTIVDIAHIEGKTHTSRLSVSIAPGKKKGTIYNRDLESDLNIIVNNNINVIVCLLEWSELYEIGIQDYPIRAQESGFFFYHLPIKDHHVPNISDVNILVPIIISHLNHGHNVLVHCSGGLGRAGIITACCLCHLGYHPTDSVSTVRLLRTGAIKGDHQVQFITDFHDATRNLSDK